MYTCEQSMQRFIENISFQVRNRQTPNLQLLFRHSSNIHTSSLSRVSDLYSAYTSADEAFLSQRIRQLQGDHLDIIKNFSRCIEIRDSLAAGHTKRLARYATVLGEALCWKRERIESLEIAAHLHDVGKICVTRSTLNKVGKLTNKELKQMQRHTKVGAEMLMRIDFLRPVIPAVLYHHERYDGKGYPEGLSGKDIPVEGRIFAVLDTFDALVNARPYRAAFSHDSAYCELKKQREGQLDPDVVDIFMEIFSKSNLSF